MRLVKTQARKTYEIVKQAEKLILSTIKNDGNIKSAASKLESILSELPLEAQKMVKELAIYEAEFTTKKIKKYLKKDVKEVSKAKVLKAISVEKVGVTLKQPKKTIDDVYNSFAATKKAQMLRVLSDAKVLKEEQAVTEKKVENLVSGLFKVQNLALAGIAIYGTVSIARSLTAKSNGFGVVWTADFENSNVCPFCEDMDGTVFKEETGDIPAHANCACFWVINEA